MLKGSSAPGSHNHLVADTHSSMNVPTSIWNITRKRLAAKGNTLCHKHALWRHGVNFTFDDPSLPLDTEAQKPRY